MCKIPNLTLSYAFFQSKPHIWTHRSNGSLRFWWQVRTDDENSTQILYFFVIQYIISRGTSSRSNRWTNRQLCSSCSSDRYRFLWVSLLLLLLTYRETTFNLSFHVLNAFLCFRSKITILFQITFHWSFMSNKRWGLTSCIVNWWFWFNLYVRRCCRSIAGKKKHSYEQIGHSPAIRSILITGIYRGFFQKPWKFFASQRSVLLWLQKSCKAIKLKPTHAEP